MHFCIPSNDAAAMKYLLNKAACKKLSEKETLKLTAKLYSEHENSREDINTQLNEINVASK